MGRIIAEMMIFNYVSWTFYRLAADIIQKMKDKRYAEAREDISLEGPLNLTSLKMRSLLAKLSFKEQPAAAVQEIPDPLDAEQVQQAKKYDL